MVAEILRVVAVASALESGCAAVEPPIRGFVYYRTQMDKGFTVAFQGDHVRIDTVAERNIDNARALWTAVVEACEKHDCFFVLAVSNAPGPMPIVDGYDHAQLFQELGIFGKYRIAWAELSDDARPATLFVETVLFNRGLPGKVFRTEEEARHWLFSEADAAKD